MSSTGATTVDARSLLWTPSDSVKDVNRRKVIRAAMADPGITQVSLAKRLLLSQGTVSAVVSELQQEGIFRVQSEEGERGKRVRLGAVRGVAVGVEVNHDRIAVAARRVDTSAVEYESMSFRADQGSSSWVRESANLIKELTVQTGLDIDHIVSIGVGIPAAVDPRTAMVTQVAASLDWDITGSVPERFRDHFRDVPIIVDNEANYAAYGEYLYGAGRGAGTVLFVKASVGLGAGLIIGGLIYRGRHGYGGEIGHLTMDPDGIPCRCGNRGCLETLVGGARLLEQVRQAYAGYRADLPTSVEGMIERAKRGDAVCRRVLQDAARTIGLALARVCNLMNPELIVLGGELGRAPELLLEPMMDGLRLYALRGMVDSKDPVKIVGSDLGLAAGARGALGFALMTDRTVEA
ncbi:ROK family transcriptional regulator [Amycolatopsis sp. lyj-23]|uniref:ROK family transcriptional regulator n=1 Tax=Amycolatopsis sp. lyj-23 TaxID=2789283 RepID=UPI00397822FF